MATSIPRPRNFWPQPLTTCCGHWEKCQTHVIWLHAVRDCTVISWYCLTFHSFNITKWFKTMIQNVLRNVRLTKCSHTVIRKVYGYMRCAWWFWLHTFGVTSYELRRLWNQQLVQANRHKCRLSASGALCEERWPGGGWAKEIYPVASGFLSHSVGYTENVSIAWCMILVNHFSNEDNPYIDFWALFRLLRQ